MQVRLGFSVAAFLEPDVLLVDEVLAVGDARFQQKCLDRMRAVLAQGTTLVFVSHNLAAVESVCRRGIWLNDGVVQQEGPDPGGARRLQGGRPARRVGLAERPWPDQPRRGDGDRSGRGYPEEPRRPQHRGEDDERWAAFGRRVHRGEPGYRDPDLPRSEKRRLRGRAHESRSVRSPTSPCRRVAYSLWVGVFDKSGREYLSWRPAISFDVFGPALDPAPVGVLRLAPVQVAAEWGVSTT